MCRMTVSNLPAQDEQPFPAVTCGDLYRTVNIARFCFLA